MRPWYLNLHTACETRAEHVHTSADTLPPRAACARSLSGGAPSAVENDGEDALLLALLGQHAAHHRCGVLRLGGAALVVLERRLHDARHGAQPDERHALGVVDHLRVDVLVGAEHREARPLLAAGELRGGGGGAPQPLGLRSHPRGRARGRGARARRAAAGAAGEEAAGGRARLFADDEVPPNAPLAAGQAGRHRAAVHGSRGGPPRRRAQASQRGGCPSHAYSQHLTAQALHAPLQATCAMRAALQ